MLGLLPSSSVTKHLGRGVQTGVERPPIATLTKSSTMKDESESRWRTQPVRELLDEAMNRFEGKRAAADGWLAPRLHATLRMTRSEAANDELWNFLALVVAPDYVVWRHKGASVATPPDSAARTTHRPSLGFGGRLNFSETAATTARSRSRAASRTSSTQRCDWMSSTTVRPPWPFSALCGG